MLTTTIDSYVAVLDQGAYHAALACARGRFQRNVLLGVEALSTATLRGKARQYSGRYRASVSNLLDRIEDCAEARGPHGKRVLVIGASVIARAVEQGLRDLCRPLPFEPAVYSMCHGLRALHGGLDPFTFDGP